MMIGLIKYLLICAVFPFYVVKSWISVIPNVHNLYNQLFVNDPYIFSHYLSLTIDSNSLSLDPSILLANNPVIEPNKIIESITSSIQSIDTNTISNEISTNVNNILQTVSDTTLSSFNKILDENPKLKLSASEFALDYYTNTLVPTYTSTTTVISNGPLAQGIQSFVSNPSTIIVDGVVPIASNIISGIAKPVSQVFEGTANGIFNTIDGVVTYIQNDGIKELPSSSSNVATTSALRLPSISIPDVIDNTVTFLSSAIITIPSALGKASTSLGTQLAQKGSILATNTASFTNAVSTTIPKLVSTSWNNAGEVLVERSSKIPTLLSPLTKSLETIANILTAYNNKINEAKEWKLFSDENHWQNGFWEQQITGLQRTVKDLSQDEIREKYLSTISDSLDKFDDRFAAQYIAKRNEYKEFDNQVLNTISAVSESLDKFDDRFAAQYAAKRNEYKEFDNQVLNTISAVSESLDKFDDRFAAQYAAKRNEYKEFDKEVVTISSNVFEFLQSVTTKTVGFIRSAKTETASLIQDTKTYVNDFIMTGKEL